MRRQAVRQAGLEQQAGLAAISTIRTNPSASKILIGQDILTGLEPDGENFWDGGRLYDATTGKTWNCNITVLPGNDKLKIRGYWGIALFGQSRVWDRVK